MATINLRPWREERRERLKREFLQVTALFAAFALGIWFMWNLVLNTWINNQNSRNQMLEAEITSLDQKVKEIQELKRDKDALIDKIRVIQGLEGSRPVIVHLFDELAKTVPDGVFYTKLERRGTKILIQGSAESMQRVSTLMRNLNESEWFENPNLTKVTANTTLGEQGNDFVLTVDISMPGADEDDAGKAKPKAPATSAAPKGPATSTTK